MSIGPALQTLRRNEAFLKDVVAWEVFPSRPARYADPPAELDGDLAGVLRRKGVWPLYTHQAQAVRAALARENVVVVTGTASGKTLCYNLPVLQSLRDEPAATALYLFPTKALAQDQLAVLGEWVEDLDGRARQRLPVNLYDGDTPPGHRTSIRKAGGVVLTNPDMLHIGILPHHTRWAMFLANLRIVVLDEIHAYRGVFGSHLANLLRRLRRVCRLYGSDPRFICTSATIANPAEHAQRLIEAPVTLVAEHDDGSPRGTRHFILYSPPMVNPLLGIRRSPMESSAQIAGTFLRSGAQTILFARSRLVTELLLTSLRDRLAPDAMAADSLQAYRGGYLPRERRSIERGLRSGKVRGVAATNALELGVDIGELSACVLVGYPGTIASTRQQAGRAGRRLGSSATVLVATASPLDQYIITHPQYLFERSPEHALINPNNLVVLVNHLRCAAFELPFETGETFGEAGRVEDILDFLSDAGDFSRGRNRYHWVADDYPAAAVSLRSGSNDNIVIQDVSDLDRPEVIGQLERESCPSLLHQGAIYRHRGQSFLVEALDWEGARADVRRISAEYYTRASLSRSLQVLRVEESARAGMVRKHHGDVLVTSQATAYRKVKSATHETLGWGEIDLPSQELETTAYWIALMPELTTELQEAKVLLGPIDYGPNWAEQRAKAAARDRGRCQHCGAEERPGRRHDVHHVQPFRTFGFISSINERYSQANALRNLITLCPICHRRAESQVRTASPVSGLAGVLRNLAPLYLMCDAHDILVLTGDDGPTVTVYERVSAGVGFSQHLYAVHTELLEAALDLIGACPCLHGCPACVGPVIAGDAGGGPPETKRGTLILLEGMLRA